MRTGARRMTGATVVMPYLCLLSLLSLAVSPALAQAPAPRPSPSPAPATPPPLVSPEVLSDRRVTFRFRAPNAKQVVLDRAGAPSVPMQKDDSGVWTVTTAPLEPDVYQYTFEADGVDLLDPSNALIVPNLLNRSSAVHVPGPSSLPWELGTVPRGTVHRHFYKSGIVGDDRDYYVYTPAGYDPHESRTYPVLYLLHGFSDDASAWTAVGRAHVILDNLIAAGKAKPMVVVMPLGYGVPDFVTRGSAVFRDASLRRRSFDRFRDALFTEVIPEVESTYRVRTDRESRAIAGLSMGGAESLFVGLNALDRFAWVGAFSSGGLGDEYDAAFAGLDAKASDRLRLLWIACGMDDRLIEANRTLHGWLDGKGVRHTMVETPGAHTWTVWRRNLATFAPLLF
jgi:enterochelin esterase-like enzyme